MISCFDEAIIDNLPCVPLYKGDHGGLISHPHTARFTFSASSTNYSTAREWTSPHPHPSADSRSYP